jgi:3-hydroxyisobutyrate dehydrogenase-like beta-hydroxyacid dehydrogenase
MNSDDRPAVGFIGLGDQGLPMATAIAEAGYQLNVWARRPASLEALGDTPHTAHATLTELAAASDIAALCVSTDEDVLRLAAELVPHLRPGSILVNRGTGTPRNAMRLAGLSAGGGVEALDAPVSGGRPAAEARTLTVLVGGTAAAAQRAEPVFRSFARHVVRLGGTGSGQLAKLFNNTLLMMNQASIADSPRSTNATPSPQRYPGRHPASTPRISPRSGPPTAAWPGTSTKRAPRWAATCWATTAQTESHTTTRPSAPGSWHA